MDEIINHFMGGGMQNDANVDEVFEALKASLSNEEQKEEEKELEQLSKRYQVIEESRQLPRPRLNRVVR